MTCVLEISGVTMTYGGITALNGVELDVRQGEVLGLVGPNGAGKTTLVDCISGVQVPDKGIVKLFDRRLNGSVSKRAQAGLARTFQHPQLVPDLTVFENLLLGAAIQHHRTWLSIVGSMFSGIIHPRRRSDVEQVLTVAEELGITGLHRSADSLTLGEQRLTEVARALCQNPCVLLLDEPFAGADARSVTAIAAAIQQVRAQGHTQILVDHNMDLIANLADRIAVLNHGRVASLGPTAEVLAGAEMREVYFGEEAVGSQ